MKLSEGLEKFKDFGRIKYAQRTVDTYTDLIQRFIKYNGDVSLKKVSPDDIIAYSDHLTRKNYADSSRAFMMISLRQYFQFLFMRRLVSWDYHLIPVNKYVSNSYKPVEQEVSQKMVDAYSIEDFISLRNKTIIAFLRSSGLRNSELCSLRVNDLTHFDDEEPYGNIISKKNHKRRMIFWDDQAHELLVKYLEQRKTWSHSDHLFVSVGATENPSKSIGKGMTTRSIQRIVEKVRPSEDVKPHGMRHGFGMALTRSKAHLRYVQLMLGHLHIGSSQVYMDLYDGDVAEEYHRVFKKKT